MWSPATRTKYERTSLRCASDLTAEEFALIEPRLRAENTRACGGVTWLFSRRGFRIHCYRTGHDRAAQGTGDDCRRQ